MVCIIFFKKSILKFKQKIQTNFWIDLIGSKKNYLDSLKDQKNLHILGTISYSTSYSLLNYT